MFNESELKGIGIYQYGYISTSEIVFGGEIRKICEGNVCRSYGTTWACPPAVGTIQECQQKLLSFNNAMVFSGKYFLEDSFDLEGMRDGHKQFKNLCDKLYFIAKDKLQSFLILSNEGCGRCAKCTYPYFACRMPEMLFPSLEGFGIYVNKLAESAGIRYINGVNTVTYFGMICIEAARDLSDGGCR